MKRCLVIYILAVCLCVGIMKGVRSMVLYLFENNRKYVMPISTFPPVTFRSGGLVSNDALFLKFMVCMSNILVSIHENIFLGISSSSSSVTELNSF